MNLGLSYGADATKNNGNVLGQVVKLGGLTNTLSYGYGDVVGRLKGYSETLNPLYNQGYDYDAFANRVVTPGSWKEAASRTPTSLAKYSDNRYTDFVYDQQDAAGPGNITFDGANQLRYDAENRLVLVMPTDGASVVGFVYDGEGRRVQKWTCPTGATACGPGAGQGVLTATYVYDAQGRLSGEVGAADTVASPLWVVGDHLGSTRLTMNAAGQAVTCHDYAPFGEELARTGGCYGGAGIRQKFTGKERDSETGLDCFEARYMSSAQGRFTSPDPAGMIVWSHSGVLESLPHVYGESHFDGMSLLRAGQSVRYIAAGAYYAFPKYCTKIGVHSAGQLAERGIENLVTAQMMSDNPDGMMGLPGSERKREGMRQCALGNPAACR